MFSPRRGPQQQSLRFQNTANIDDVTPVTEECRGALMLRETAHVHSLASMSSAQGRCSELWQHSGRLGCRQLAFIVSGETLLAPSVVWWSVWKHKASLKRCRNSAAIKTQSFNTEGLIIFSLQAKDNHNVVVLNNKRKAKKLHKVYLSIILRYWLFTASLHFRGKYWTFF